MTFSLQSVAIVQSELLELVFFREVFTPQVKRMQDSYKAEISAMNASDSIRRKQIETLSNLNRVSDAQISNLRKDIIIANAKNGKLRQKRNFWRNAALVLGAVSSFLILN